MKKFILLVALFWGIGLSAQSFPDSYIGYWKGDLDVYKGDSVAFTIQFGLEVFPADSGRYDWVITYYLEPANDDTVPDKIDRRPYLLVPIDTANGHWAIDENNGIIIDMYTTGNKVTSLFSVEGSMIQISYWLEGDEMVMELFTYPEKEDLKTGKGTEEIPEVKVWKFTGYQLGRMKHLKGVK